MLLEIKGVLRVKYILNKVFTVAESIMLFIPVESHFDKRKTLPTKIWRWVCRFKASLTSNRRSDLELSFQNIELFLYNSTVISYGHIYKAIDFKRHKIIITLFPKAW